ncbi:MAG: alanine racemase [Bellilinea sp.]
MDHSLYPTWVEIDLSAAAHNTRAVLEIAGVPLMAVVKSNAYGFGAVEISRTVLSAGATQLAVARFNEARTLRQAGITAPILVFGMVTEPEVDEAISQGVTLTLHSFENAVLFSQRAKTLGGVVCVHLKVDTGFGRLGVLPGETIDLVRACRQTGGIQIDGIYSHLAMADEAPDHPVTQQQIQRFTSILNALESAGLRPAWAHLANSAAAFGLPEARFDLVRVGTALLGMKPFYFQPFPGELRRVISWKAQLASCRLLPAGWGVSYGHEYTTKTPEWIGTLPVGYGDGFRRQPGNQVLIEGRRVPVVGRVCNDMCMVLLPHEIPVGMEVVIVGRQGGQEITTDELIDRWHTSQADITTGINWRVPRIYTNPVK